MNDEIKEILDIMKKCYDLKDENFDNYITLYQLGLLLDYITNLQQAVKDTKDTADDMLFELQQENERLKQEYINVRNYIKMRNVDTEVEDKALLYNIELENINKKKYLDYKSRCEKAIEYIKYNDSDLYTFEPDYDYEENLIDNYEPSNFREDLLNILQNGSEDNVK